MLKFTTMPHCKNISCLPNNLSSNISSICWRIVAWRNWAEGFIHKRSCGGFHFFVLVSLHGITHHQNLSSNISLVVLADCDSECEQMAKKDFIQEKKRWILDRFLPFLCLTSMASLENVQKSCPLCRLYQFNSANNLVTKPISLMDIGGRAASRSQHQKLETIYLITLARFIE